MRNLLLLPLLLFLLTACVGKKRYDRTVLSYDRQVDSLQTVLTARDSNIRVLTLDLAHSRGANEALFQTQDRLQDRLDLLQLQIDSLNRRASNTQESFAGERARLEREKANLQQQLQDITDLFNRRAGEATAIAAALKDTLPALADSVLFTIETRAGATILSLQEDLLFRRGQTDRLESRGQAVLREVARIVLGYPVQTVQVIGHTDNSDPGGRLDNWQFSALRAATVVRFLQNADLGPNRLLVSGKGEYAPRQSNATREGQLQNRRIELLIQPRETDLMRDIGRIMRN